MIHRCPHCAAKRKACTMSSIGNSCDGSFFGVYPTSLPSGVVLHEEDQGSVTTKTSTGVVIKWLFIILQPQPVIQLEHSIPRLRIALKTWVIVVRCIRYTAFNARMSSGSCTTLLFEIIIQIQHLPLHDLHKGTPLWGLVRLHNLVLFGKLSIDNIPSIIHMR